MVRLADMPSDTCSYLQVPLSRKIMMFQILSVKIYSMEEFFVLSRRAVNVLSLPQYIVPHFPALNTYDEKPPTSYVRMI